MTEEPLDFVPIEEDPSAAEQIARKTPWWGISVGVHTLGVMLCIYVFAFAVRERPMEITQVRTAPRIVEPPKMEKPEKISEEETPPVDPTKDPVKDPIFRKDAIESDHIETADEEEFEKAKGDSLDFISDKPFKSINNYDVIGVGGGVGGRYGGRLGGARDLTCNRLGGAGTQGAVLAALKWLARHQNEDGSWSGAAHQSRCNRTLQNGKTRTGTCSNHKLAETEYDAGVTGLSLLAFLGAGYSHLSRDTHEGICFGEVVRKGVQWMMNRQDPEGCIGGRHSDKYMYNHTICALALSEAYGLTGSSLFRDQAQKAVDFTVASQNPGMGWRYTYQCGDNDTSVTGWAVMVLKSAELSGLAFSRETAYGGARDWLDEVTESTYYRVGYNAPNTGKVFEPGVNEHFSHHDTLAAIAVMSRIFMDQQKHDPRLRGGCQLLVKDLPRWDENEIDFYYWYYASLALFQYDCPDGTFWKQWNESMKHALLPNQKGEPHTCAHGSWDPVGRWSHSGGRVYATAINALTLEVYYRYKSVFGTQKENQ